MATTITVYTDKDAMLSEPEPDSNFGSDWTIRLGLSARGEYTMGMFGFNLTGLIPSQNIIKSMEFHCYVGSANEYSDQLQTGSNFSGDWNESTITFDTPIGGQGYSTGGVIATPQSNAWNTCSLPDLIPRWNILRPNRVSVSTYAFGSGVEIYAREYASGAYRAYLTITHDVGSVPKIATSRGSINKAASGMYIAAAQGAINKKVVGIKAAVTQGPINKTVF